jgi:hypothetical protein
VRPGLNEHIEADGPTVFAHACKMSLEGIVRSARPQPIVPAARPTGLKSKNPDAPAVKREAEEDWGKRRRR